MIARHTFKIHARCPLVPHEQWDYYDVVVQTEDTLDVHVLEKAMDSVRGVLATQEQIATILKEQLPCETMVEVIGRHSQTSETTVVA
jgi:hypothetical protein